MPAGVEGQTEDRASPASSRRRSVAASRVYIEGNLFRLAGEDADAIGKEASSRRRCRRMPPKTTCANWPGPRCETVTTPRSRSTSWTSASSIECDVTPNATARDISVTDDADRAGLRHGRSAGRRREGQDRDDSDGTKRPTSNSCSIRLEPVDDVGSRAPADRHDVSWVRVAPAASIAPGEYATAEVDGVFVAVFNVGGEFLAVEDVCTHDGGGLAGGFGRRRAGGLPAPRRAILPAYRACTDPARLRTGASLRHARALMAK